MRYNVAYGIEVAQYKLSPGKLPIVEQSTQLLRISDAGSDAVIRGYHTGCYSGPRYPRSYGDSTQRRRFVPKQRSQTSISLHTDRQHLGSYNYAQSFGVSSLKDDGNHHHLQLDTLFWLGSCTKLMTVVATLQCVERGYFTLDEDVTRLLPELSSLEVKRPSSGEGGTVTTGKRTKTITLR